MTLAEVLPLIEWPKFCLWGEWYFLVPWYGDGLLWRVDPDDPEISHVRGEHVQDKDVWYSDPDGGGE
jgi:hypothetical protein